MILPLPACVKAAFDAFPELARYTLLNVRSLIFQTAAQNPAVGPLTETLKWGEPAYLTEETKSGSTIRMAWKPAKPDHGALFFNCKTTLVNTMREIYPDSFTYQGTRAVLFRLDQPLPNDALAHCIEMALTYHRNKR
ncbi:DUF1801 domain-containing protein [Profundibacter amoris]|uniref:DUF1801 domain-containing protein n=1 Tax=Profundibacter amoris TaxID=2171755 RepID=A0A347UF72_9RHOB|nr:DUF1801 domain-containing protein [Profundibacter amoris]AXX97500.1 DUF1801 domain-containing protein [Profundibacter amoris]